ncbi:polysaccharide deacetylase family protein [Aneurinibacillus sp. Ricciae_BoGa-3]|uniref:polysaccharide deacetylase family protein n=1 Tax=Aneurinibacillus sp. Ricciae_BoGa-3 TaxID=3022697 RepID=UPI00233F85FE|nr:polysaccharide deacetylase family protein [Aneurinibacillus sp. Ricciae_BoGa-3]WCK56035.1 polysaccharide deacetylase family protein [Aneurinibacillus sp. Ricciae_BoGa-3]
MRNSLLYKLMLVLFTFILSTSPYAAEISSASTSNQHIIRRVPVKKKIIALTFDDGPHPVYTRKIMKVLDKYQAKATFFVVGERAQYYPSVVQELKQKGHEIANHTFSHPRINRISSSKLLEEIQKTDDIIHSLTGEFPALFRSPGGMYNPMVLDAVKKKHLVPILWSAHQDSRDWANPGIHRIVRQVTENAKAGNIILMHDSGVNRTQTVRALDQILQILSREGYSFVTISELISQSDEDRG